MSPVPGMDDGSFYIRAQWKLCRVVWPQRCEITGRRLWPGTQAYRGTVTWSGTEKPTIEYKWHARQEHLMWQLKD
jgi:hypothetical protein